MIKKLFVTIYHVVLLSTLTGFVGHIALAMGLGDITVLSKLNEPLNIEIAIIDTSSTPIDDIVVRNAHRETYKRARLLNPDIFNKVRFKIVKKTNGSVIARLTSRRPVKEPFITFIADLRWPEGHINREYTFLLDPPEFIKKQARPIYTAKPESPRKIPATKPESVAKASENYSQVIANHTNQRSYTTRRSDTLWKIAKKFRPDDQVSTWQTMQAIFVLNENAFINGDINLLKQDQKLTLPNSNEVRQINGKAPLKKGSAHKPSRTENYALTSQKSPSRVVEPIQRKKSSKNKQANTFPEEDQARLKIIPPTETLLNKPVTSKKDLLLINKALKASMDTIKLLQTENKILMAQVDNLNQKISNLDSHNVELNDKILEISRLLKDRRTAEALTSSRLGDNPQISVSPNSNSSPAKAVETTESSLSISTPVKSDKAKAAQITLQTTAAQPKPGQHTFIQELISNPVISFALAIFAVVILIGTYFTFKKHKQHRNDDTDTPYEQPTVLSSIKNNSSPEPEESVVKHSVTAKTSTGSRPETLQSGIEKNEDEMDFFEYFEKKINAPDESDSNASSVKARSNKINTSEVDFSLDISEEDIQDYEQSVAGGKTGQQPIENPSAAEILSEVDTYIAYGNYNTAEDILTSAIIKSPLSKDLNLKLFECYALANKRYEFIQHTKQVINLLNENMVLRHRVENIYQQTWNETLDITQLS